MLTLEKGNDMDIQNTVKPVNKGHPLERQDMVFIDKWSLLGDNLVLFYQERFIEVWPFYIQGGLYLEVDFETGLTVTYFSLTMSVKLKISRGFFYVFFFCFFFYSFQLLLLILFSTNHFAFIC